MKIAILASGPSLNDDDVQFIYQKRITKKLDHVLAVSDVGLLKAPWADALVSHDSGWWISKKGSIDFKGRKFSARGYNHTEKFDYKSLGISGGLNSGLFAMFIARDVYKASSIFLLGFDLHRRNGQHFFGPHVELYNNRCLLNTDEKKFSIHINQFNKFKGCEVWNCTIGSDLKCFPFMNIRDMDQI